MAEVTYLRNEHLRTIKPGYPGNKLINGQFANGDKLFHPPFRLLLKWWLSPNPQKAEKKADPFKIPVQTLPAEFFAGKEDAIVWLGHATFLIRLGGRTFLTDPVFYDLPLLKRKPPLPCAPESLKPIDYLLLSHGHRDHLDERSVQVIFRQNFEMKALVPLKMAPLLQQFTPGMETEEAGWYQQFTQLSKPEVEVYYLPACHWHRRDPWDMNQVLWGSFLLKAGGKTVYFTGDSASGLHFQEIGNLFGPIEYCLMPIGAYKPEYLMQEAHTSPQQAVDAFHALQGRNFIPMHFGTFDLSNEPPGEPIRLLRAIHDSGNLNGNLLTPAIGEVVWL